MNWARFVIFVVLGTTLSVTIATDARADDREVSARGIHWSVGGGGSLFLTGSPSSGSLFDGELYPGGRFGRLGIRLEARGLDETSPRVFAAGVSFEAAASRPRLVVSLYATVGADTDGNPVGIAGVQSQLAIIGPLAVGLDAGGVLVIDGTADTELLLGSSLTLRLAR